MIFTACPLDGAWLIDVEPATDERGFFARTWCRREFAAHGIGAQFLQASVSGNARRATLRGLHYQAGPHQEAKLVRCTAGAVFDVIVDLRPRSAGYLRWYGVELSAANHRALYVPEGCAHGFITLADDSEVLYLISAEYAPGAAHGVRWDDPAVGVRWPLEPLVISARDAAWPLLAGGPGPAR